MINWVEPRAIVPIRHKADWDFFIVYNEEEKVKGVTKMDKEFYLSVYRHSLAHILAKAVIEIYGKDVQYAIGPQIKDGAYYDFELPEGHTYSAGTTFKFEDIFKYQVNGGGIDVSTQSAAQLVLAGIDYLITAVDTKRSELGAIQNRLESTIRNQENVAENVSDSRALIRDADYAEEVSVMTSSQILQQGSITILTQANQKSQVALQMLQDSY